MATVPIYEQQVATEAGGTPTPQLQGLPEAASGINIAQAAAGIGKTVEEHAGQLAKSIVYVDRMNSQMKAQDIASGAVQKLQGLHSQLSNLQGSQAIGIVHGNDPDKLDPNSWLAQAQKLKNETIKGLPLYQARMVNRIMDSHINVMTGSLIDHETKQTKVARDQSDNAAHAVLVNSGAVAANPDDLKNLMDQGKQIVRNQAAREGHDLNDKNIAASLDQHSNDQFAKAFVGANLERDPQKTQDMLNSIGGEISPVTKAELQTHVDGKMLDLRRAAVQDQVKGLVHADGTADVAAREAKAQELVNTEHIPQGQKQHIIDFVKQQAAIDDAALKDAKTAQTRAFFNDALAARNKGIPYEQTEEYLFKKKGYGTDPLDHDEKVRQLQALYTKDEDFYDQAMKHQTEDQKLAWKQIEDMATVKFGKQTSVLPGDESNGIKTPLKDAYILEMKHQLMGLPREQMLDRATKALENVVTEKHQFWFDKKVPAWQIQRDVRQTGDQEMATLENHPEYGSLVGPVRAGLIERGLKNPSAKDIKDAIDKAKGR